MFVDQSPNNLKNRAWSEDHLYLIRIESRNFVTGVCMVRACEALHTICLQIQDGMESFFVLIRPISLAIVRGYGMESNMG